MSSDTAVRTDLTTAFVLHTRKYTDSRILVELFTAEYGRIGAVARSGAAGAASGKKAAKYSSLRPFQPLLVSWQGKTDLKTMTGAEPAGPAVSITGSGLYCGMYLNELLLRVTANGDPQPTLFIDYQKALGDLARGQPVEPVLRNFELDLLAELGYGIPFDADASTGMPLVPERAYAFDPHEGFASAPGTGRGQTFSGAALLAIGQRDFSEPEVRQAAKRVCRSALQPLLGDRPLKSRELFR